MTLHVPDSLDPYHQLHVMEILRGLARKGVGVLAVIHDLALAARFMDRIVLLHRGGIAGDGSPAEVLSPDKLNDVYRVSALRGEEGGNRSTVFSSYTDFNSVPHAAQQVLKPQSRLRNQAVPLSGKHQSLIELFHQFRRAPHCVAQRRALGSLDPPLDRILVQTLK